MMRTRRRAVGRGGLALIGALLLGAPAQAIQFTPIVGDRVHTVGSGEPGVEWNTGANGGTGGQIDYNSGTEELTITGAIDVLNFFNATTPGRAPYGTCGSDAGTNCSVNFSPDLDFSVEAALANISTTEVVPGLIHEIIISFESTSDGMPDIVWTDPSDGDAVVLEADWIGGLFGGDFTFGLTASLLYNEVTMTVLTADIDIAGFLEVDSGSTYASLFDSGGNFFAVDLQTLDNFSPSLDAIAKAAFEGDPIPDFTGDGAGNIFRLESGDFVVPEPSTGLLVWAGLGVLAAWRRRN